VVLEGLECQVSELVHSDACPCPTTRGLRATGPSAAAASGGGGGARRTVRPLAWSKSSLATCRVQETHLEPLPKCYLLWFLDCGRPAGARPRAPRRPAARRT
jgi:hypothetical protein